ncbi:Uncharacterized protein Fot_16192 [Forsythia ovata]|uniref:Uncharacterized protein n=1 Tax=Forsythia ovata TaxID=205694 RepID=A0ABD1WBB3_9LAMI
MGVGMLALFLRSLPLVHIPRFTTRLVKGPLTHVGGLRLRDFPLPETPISMASNSSFENSWADQWDPEPLYNYNSNTKTSGSSKISGKVGDKLDKTKAAATTGMRKVKTGATVGFHWIKDKYQKRKQKN